MIVRYDLFLTTHSQRKLVCAVMKNALRKNDDAIELRRSFFFTGRSRRITQNFDRTIKNREDWK
jgi:hypothetical protein